MARREEGKKEKKRRKKRKKRKKRKIRLCPHTHATRVPVLSLLSRTKVGSTQRLWSTVDGKPIIAKGSCSEAGAVHSNRATDVCPFRHNLAPNLQLDTFPF